MRVCGGTGQARSVCVALPRPGHPPRAKCVCVLAPPRLPPLFMSARPPRPMASGAGRSLDAQCAQWCDGCLPWCCKESACLGCQGKADGSVSCNRPAPPPPPPPIPPRPAPPPDTADYFTSGNRLHTTAFDTAGSPLRIKGASWFGLESSTCYIGGADQAPVSKYMEWLKENKFNALRVPLAADAILGQSRCLSDDGVYYSHNYEFMGLDYGEQLRLFVHKARDAGLLVLLDLHVAKAGQCRMEERSEARLGSSR